MTAAASLARKGLYVKLEHRPPKTSKNISSGRYPDTVECQVQEVFLTTSA